MNLSMSYIPKQNLANNIQDRAHCIASGFMFQMQFCNVDFFLSEIILHLRQRFLKQMDSFPETD